MSALRRWVKLAARTPLHPQWLLGSRNVPVGIEGISGRVLDIGAADRWIESRLPVGVEYLALDYPPTGRDLYGARPDVFGDGARLPFSDGCFDGVICLEVLEHVTDPAAVLDEIGRVLTSGGRAWLSMPFLYPLHDAPFDFQRYTAYGLQRDARKAGLAIVRLHKSGHAIRTAGVLMCMAIAGALEARRGVRWLFFPLASLLVLAINLLAWLLSLGWPDWTNMALGHELEIMKL